MRHLNSTCLERSPKVKGRMFLHKCMKTYNILFEQHNYSPVLVAKTGILINSLLSRHTILYIGNDLKYTIHIYRCLVILFKTNCVVRILIHQENSAFLIKRQNIS